MAWHFMYSFCWKVNWREDSTWARTFDLLTAVKPELESSMKTRLLWTLASSSGEMTNGKWPQCV